ncbi:hypothetical protein, partial [Neisseria gonorrhoeae]|uniref:hypothetical protein n=5 Tax=Neisseria gonorrhoeae TaxID=485 RepID=UPI0039BE7B06
MPSEAPSFRRHIHKGASAGGEEEGGLEAAQRLAEIKNLIRQRHDEFPQKNPAESIDCFPLRAYSSVLRRCRSGGRTEKYSTECRKY